MSLTGLLLLALAHQAPPLALQLPRRPELRGKTYAAAEEILRRFKITVVTRDAPVREGPSGIVLAQYPAAGTPIKPGSVDTLILSSRRSDYVPVPDVVGRPYRVAVRMIQGARLVPQGRDLPSIDSANALVVAQKPNPQDSALPGSAVQLDVRREVRVPVPRLVGRDSARARESIERARLRARPPDLDYDDHAAPGVVTHQDPPAGDSVPAGSVVRIRVSKGPHRDTTLVVMPRLLDQVVERARTMVEGAHLALSHIDSVPQANGRGRIIAQEPHAGDTVHIGDPVRVTVTVPQPTAMVPPLVGRPRAKAEDTLRALKLQPAPISFAADPVAEDGIVMRQSVLPGTFLPVGQSVGLEINVRPPRVPVIVPRVVGLGLAAAEDTIVARRLTIRSITRRAGASGIVLGQAPAAGTSVDRGASMELSVGRDSNDDPDGPPPPRRIRVPDVRDSLVATAVKSIRTAGFVNLVVDSAPASPPVLEWTIAAQKPAARAVVLPQTLVRLSAKATGGVVTPHLVDRKPDEAALVAQLATLRMRVTGSQTTLRLAGSVVRTQAIAPDSIVAAGATIDVTIANPIPFIVSAGVGVLGLGLGGAAVIRTEVVKRWLKKWLEKEPEPPKPQIKPAIKVELDAEMPTLNAPSDRGFVETAIAVTVDFEAPQLSVPDTSAILEEPIR